MRNSIPFNWLKKREVRDRHREALEEMRRNLRDMKDAQKPGRN